LRPPPQASRPAEKHMAGENREYVFLECSETGVRHYRTQKRVKGQNIKKLELKKYSAKLRKHTIHKERKK
jgi:large subunit ribosomal protein L33